MQYIALLICPAAQHRHDRRLRAARRGGAAARQRGAVAPCPTVADPAHPRRRCRDDQAARPSAPSQFRRRRASATTPTVPVLDGFDLRIAAGDVRGARRRDRRAASRRSPACSPASTTSSDGRVEIDGVDIRDLRLHDAAPRRRHRVRGHVPVQRHGRGQHRLRPSRRRRDDVERAARLAGAHDFVIALPDGYDTMIGERGFSLSGGQRQRIAIARAILADPRVLVLDDATSAVDPSKEHEIREAMAHGDAAAARRS